MTFTQGISGKNAAVFNEQSRVAIDSFGPLGQGEVISYSFFFKTASNAEVILVAFASQYKPQYGQINFTSDLSKDILLLSLKNGVPHLYASHQRYLISNIREGALNKGEWNSIAISMPSKSCYLSEVKMYINGALQPTTLVGSNTQMFFYTTGSVSIGGWGYAHFHHESFFPDVLPLTGQIDEFTLWGRSLTKKDLRKSLKKKFTRNIDIICDYSNQSELNVGKRGPKKCRQRCRNSPKCWGYELVPLQGGGFECFVYDERPAIGNQTVLKGQCNPAV